MPMSRPRTAHISASLRCSRSAPSSSTRPDTSAPRGGSPITASAVIDFPDPLSPMTPSTSPAAAAIATSRRIAPPLDAQRQRLDAPAGSPTTPLACRESGRGQGSRSDRAKRGLALTPARLAAPHWKRRLDEAAASSGASPGRPFLPCQNPRRQLGRGASATPKPRATPTRRPRRPAKARRPHARARRTRGSSRSRKPSPIRFSPSTVSTMARPGISASRGAKAIIVWLSASIRPQDGVGGCAPSPT